METELKWYGNGPDDYDVELVEKATVAHDQHADEEVNWELEQTIF